MTSKISKILYTIAREYTLHEIDTDRAVNIIILPKERFTSTFRSLNLNGRKLSRFVYRVIVVCYVADIRQVRRPTYRYRGIIDRIVIIR